MDRVDNRLDNSLDKTGSVHGAGALSSPPVGARLKWFNIPKGFGFVVAEDSSADGGQTGDAFLHITTLQKAGVTALGDNASFLCYIEYGPNGAHVTHILELTDPGTSVRSVSCAGDGAAADAKPHKMKGVVKWYNPEKEFGFIVPEDGGKDVFVHKKCLEKNGLAILRPGQCLLMSFRSVPKGREAVGLTLLD